MKYDVLIIGGGICGSSIAFELSKYNLKVALMEKENDVAMKTTKANSAIIHAGYDPKPGTVMARLNVLGSNLVRELAPKLNFHYKSIGSLVVGRNEKDHRLIDELYERGVKNGVKGMKVLRSRKEIEELGETNLKEGIDYALYAPSAAIVSPWEMCLAFAENAVVNGVDLHLQTAVREIHKEGDFFRVVTDQGDFEAKYVINAAGTHADEIYNMVLEGTGKKGFEILPVRGEYYLLDKDQGELVHHVIFQTPSEKGKGVLVSQTVHGNLIVGPDADFDHSTKDDVGNTASSMAFVRTMALESVPSINFGSNIRNFAGVRANIKGYDDFLIGESDVVKGFINFAGIKSPGLSCGPAFGLEAKSILEKDGVKFVEKKEYKTVALPKYFKELSDEEKDAKIKEDKRYGQVICRCETITEGEIVAAMHSPIPAHTIDGIKRRTNAGMGRCQGGFCGPKVFDLLMKELHLKFDEVYQDREGSQVVVEKTKEEK